jgi:1,4-dihydroxy-2-naphthoyl-CoA hydrolase
MSFTYDRTVRFGDTDAAGVVYFANVLSICHEAYEAALIDAGIDARSFFKGDELAVPIVHGEVDFHQPMRCGDRLVVRVLPVMTAASEFEVRYEVLLAGRDRPVSRGLTRHVCIDVKTRKRILIPAMVRQWIEGITADTAPAS